MNDSAPIPDPAGIPKPPDEFKDWLDCALFAADSQPYEYGAPQVQKDQMQNVVKNARAELQALRGRVAELEAALRPIVAIADAYDANDLDDEARKRWDTNVGDKFYCGCCGNGPIEDPAMWCKLCDKHVLIRGPIWERTYFAQHNKPCPHESRPLPSKQGKRRRG